MRRSLAALSFLLLFGTATTPLFAAATITIVNIDAPGVGFNDPTPAIPVGGNNGTTVGQQRLNVFQFAADKWGSILTSSVPIFIQASFAPLSCSETSGTLGQAGPVTVESDWAGLVPPARPGTWYAVALANKLAGRDLEPEAGMNGYDISAMFNGNLGNSGCLTGTFWYYGLDNNHGGSIDLAVVLLHEFAHGLGFINFVDPSTGVYLQGQPDIASVFTFDDQTGLHWTDMTNAQRQASAVNNLHLTWDGTNTKAAVPLTLSAAEAFLINSPASLAGPMQFGTASFGGTVTLAGLTGSLVLANDPADSDGPSTTDGCSAFTNASAIAGNIALVDRGTCNFSVKAKNAQLAGALAIVVIDNKTESIPGLGGSDDTVTIPAIEITLSDGNRIKAALPGVNVTLKLDATQLAGADSGDRALLFAPNPVQSGSSVSHWDVSATPNLLMEPNINPDLPQDVDLTKNFFEDIGWFSPVGLTATLAATSPSDNGARPGDVIQYTATIANGDDDIDGIGTALDLTLDPNTTPDGDVVTTAGTATANGNAIHVDLGRVIGGTSATVTFGAKVNATVPLATTSVSVQGTVSGRSFTSLVTDDPSTHTAGDATVTAVDHSGILTATLSVALQTDRDLNGIISRGDRVIYTATITNAGSDPATGTSFSVGPPAFLTLVPGSVTTTAGDVVLGNGSSDSSVSVSTGTIAPGTSVTIQFCFDINPNTPAEVFALATQGTVSGLGFPLIKTDDPSTPEPDDPTTIFLPIARHRAIHD